MKCFKYFPKNVKEELKYILFDIDDTITEGGKLKPEAYQAMWCLNENGFRLIPVTGRPAGWCDMIMRQWPVDAVVGENGAFCFYQKGKTIETLLHPHCRSDTKEKLKQIRDVCLQKVPGCRVAKDQFARLYDLAVDFNEDEPKLGFDAAYKIQEICESFGAKAKVSSIHVNVWFGNYDKLSMVLFMFEKLYGEKNIKEKSLFFGDSPNDEPMFGFFDQTCAVANIKPFLSKLTHKPTYVTEKECGQGFAEAVNFLISIR